MPGLCGTCGKPNATAICGGCSSVYYCDSACQKKHWKAGHKKECKQIQATKKKDIKIKPQNQPQTVSKNDDDIKNNDDDRNDANNVADAVADDDDDGAIDIDINTIDNINEYLINLLKDKKFNTFRKLTVNMDNLSDIIHTPGESLLHLALDSIHSNDCDILKYLIINKKCDINMVDNCGASVLYYAANNNLLNAIKYLISLNVDPLLINNFTNKKAKDISQNEETIKLLTKYTNTFSQKLFRNPYGDYLYNLAQYWRKSMQSLIHPNKNVYKGFIVHPNAIKIYNNNKENGLKKLIIKCKEFDEKYVNFMNDNLKLDYNFCMICGEMVDNTLCPFCQKVPICDLCPFKTDILWKEIVKIHTKQCKEGMFDDYNIPKQNDDDNGDDNKDNDNDNNVGDGGSKTKTAEHLDPIINDIKTIQTSIGQIQSKLNIIQARQQDDNAAINANDADKDKDD